MNKSIVIIGGGAAGPKTAAKLRRLDSSLEIDLYTEEEIISYSACGMPYFIGGMIDSSEKLIMRTAEQFGDQGINVHLKHKCTKIFSKGNKVRILDLDSNKTFTKNYDILVLATGARPYIPPMKNYKLKNIFTLRHISDAVQIKDIMHKSKTATIVGGGYIGIELLEAFVKNGLNVNVIDINPYVMNVYDDDMAELIQKHILEKDGDKVKIFNSQKVEQFIGDENGFVKKVLTSEQEEIDTDFVIICAGVIPNTELGDEIGLKKGIANSYWVNSHLQTSVPNIYAVGDCAQKKHIVSNRYCWLPLGSTANKEGRCAALNIMGDNCNFDGVLGSSVSRYFGFTMAMTGVTEREARCDDVDVVSATVNKKDKAGYMPDAKNITLKLIVSKNSRHIVGAQAIGCGEANSRIGIVSSAILDMVKVDDFVNLDIPYSPPYSTSIDPLLNVAQIVIKKLKDYYE